MKILVAFASKHDATKEIAAAIGRVLGASGFDVEVRSVEDVENLDGVDAVVLGSAVYVGRWRAPARHFVDANAEALSARPVWLFSSGPLGDPLKPDEEQAVDVDSIVAATSARDHRLFGGKLDRSRLGFGERAVVTAVRASEGDFRDWGQIDGWATGIAEALSADSHGPSEANGR